MTSPAYPSPAGDAATDPHPWDEVFVLREYDLRDGIDLEQTSRFRDEIWSLGPGIHQTHGQRSRVHFASFPRRYRRLAKELLCAYMAMPVPAGGRRLKLPSIEGEVVELRRFLTWMADRPDAPDLATLTGADLRAYSGHVGAALREAPSTGRARSAVRRIWRHRNTLPGDRLLLDPHHVEGWLPRNRQQRGENRHERLPEQVMGPLIVWATRFVDVFAPDILAAARMWSRRRDTDPPPPSPDPRGPELASALEHLLNHHIHQNLPLPGYRGQVNSSELARTLGCSPTTLTRSRSRHVLRIHAVADLVGVAEDSYYATPVHGLLDGRPWLDRIALGQGDDGLAVLGWMLQIACYTLLAFYSGMRDSEIKHLRRGALRVERSADGVAYRWKVHSLAFKGEHDQKGTPAIWVVGDAAGRAIGVLEALQPAGTQVLFQTRPYGSGWREDLVGRTPASKNTNRALNRFVGWVNDYCARQGRQDGIPEVDGRAWRLKTSQFRRTLAWFIARRPGGAIAGAIAFRHQAIQMFEGYAGTSESGFRAEVESEQALARGEFLLQTADTYHHEHLVGPGAEEAGRRLEQFGLRADGFAGTVVTDERRLARLMKRHDPAIYPGTYVACVFTHDKALCRKKADSTGVLLPELGDCKPLTCGNVALTRGNAARWQAESDRIDSQLAHRPRLPPLLEHRLTQRRDQINAFLTRHRPGAQQ